MKWEFLGMQELSSGKGFSHVTMRPPLWRLSVPGGWFVMMNHTGDPFFYPDQDHLWNPTQAAGEQMLLRPAMEKTPDQNIPLLPASEE